MRITRICVSNLFGMFNHEITLNAAERVTIIIGPNGFGKTTILRLINSLVIGDINTLYTTPFDELEIEFNDLSSLSLTRKLKNNKSGINDFSLELTYKDILNPEKHFDLLDFLAIRSPGVSYSSLEEINQDPDFSYFRLREREVVENSNIFDMYRRIVGGTFDEKSSSPWTNRLLRRLINDKDFQNKFNELDEIVRKIRVHFTTTQRLLRNSVKDRYGESRIQNPVVKEYSDDLSKQIEMTLARAMQHAQDIDSSFPKRITNNLKRPPKPIDMKKLYRELEELDSKRSKLRNTGLFLELGDDLGVKEEVIAQDRINLIGSVLKEYIKDTQEKFRDFDELVSKLELLKGIINDRFIFKTFEITKENGFIVKNSQNEVIPVDRLSSGEQQELVMFYEFLFKVPKDSILLIDEPELSLHIDWQQKFLKDLLEVAKLVGFDVLIATHSPAVINHYWDLTVDLGEEGQHGWS